MTKKVSDFVRLMAFLWALWLTALIPTWVVVFCWWWLTPAGFWHGFLFLGIVIPLSWLQVVLIGIGAIFTFDKLMEPRRGVTQ
jgi:hypothetical protein